MHITAFLPLATAFLAAAAPSIQISVDITDVSTAKGQAATIDNHAPISVQDDRTDSLPYNFTLRAIKLHGPPLALPYGFENAQQFQRGELGVRSVFALHDKKLLLNNYYVGYHPARIYPPWTALWPTSSPDAGWLEVIAVSKPVSGERRYFLEIANPNSVWGALEYKPRGPVVIVPNSFSPDTLITLEIVPESEPYEIGNAERSQAFDSARDLL